MPITIIAGAQWGDEGKGKLVDHAAAHADLVVRFQGGANAGHTIVTDAGRFALHMLPSGVFRSEVLNILGAGVALDVPSLVQELQALEQAGLPRPRLLVSDRARVVLQVHRQLDCLEEERLNASAQGAFGSTRRGIAPLYACKALKQAIPVGVCGDPDALARAVDHWHGHLEDLMPARYGCPAPSRACLIADARSCWEPIRDLIGDSGAVVRAALANGAQVLGECQLGALRDVDHGILPWTTSTSTLASALPPSLGVRARELVLVTAAVKCYSSSVGAGPLVTELSGGPAEHVRRFGQERGSTTGRIRRVGWLDLVATGYGCALQGADEITLTMLDVLSGLSVIPVATAYVCNGERSAVFPPSHLLERCTPCYEELPGWSEDLQECRQWRDLPVQAHDFVRFIARRLALPVVRLSVGAHRAQTIAVPAAAL